jgi:hypothetical protein
MSVRTILAAALLLLSLDLAAGETTQSSLSKYGTELAAVWTTYPAEKDETVRKQKINDLNTVAIREINKLPAPENMTLQKAVDTFGSNLQRARTLFRIERTQNERQQFISACGAAFRRELPQTTDLAGPRTANKCFEILADWCEASRNVLRTAPEEAQSPYYTGLSEAFSLMLKKATKDAGDPTAIYDNQLKSIRKRFPVTSPIFEKTNQPIVNVLEGAAKSVNTFNKK